MKETTLYWLAGLLEGEGSFTAGPPSAPNQPRISLQMTDEDVVEKVAALFGVGYLFIRRDPRNLGWKDYFKTQVVGFPAVTLMRRLRPLMGQRRQQQIDKALASYVGRLAGDNSRKLTAEQAAEVRERVKTEPVAALSREYGISRATVYRIRDGKTWKEPA